MTPFLFSGEPKQVIREKGHSVWQRANALYELRMNFQDQIKEDYSEGEHDYFVLLHSFLFGSHPHLIECDDDYLFDQEAFSRPVKAFQFRWIRAVFENIDFHLSPVPTIPDSALPPTPLERFFAEKELEPRVYEVHYKDFHHLVESEYIIEFILNLEDKKLQKTIQDILFELDRKNKDIHDFLEHVANGYVELFFAPLLHPEEEH
ncbi:MAG: hypothetical protein GF308_08140 [Candidatus Heimdallarchaeota archaeon]|nr:hypothetical protein [Candidatus Heimdallarchaeota archaeon]